MTSVDTIFKAYDIRGIVPDELTEDIAWKIGWAFADFTPAGRIIVGRDARTSSKPLSDAFCDGVRDRGDDVLDIGLASTDMLYFASGRFESPGAMFTASHNPAEYNGLKLCLSEAKPVGETTGLADVKNRVLRDEFPAALSRGVKSREDVLPAFVDHVLSFVDTRRLRPLKVAVDTANGMGGLVVPAAFEKLPFEVVPLYFELDGTFPNHPADPIQPENLRDLISKVVSEGADVGLAFDGDADRVFLVDNDGEPISGSTTTAMVAKGMLEKNPGETILHNLICSRAVPEIVRETGGSPVRSRVGHSFIKEQMAETNAVFAGEHSGHYYFRDNFRADSGLIAALVVLEQLSASDRPLSELRKPFERYASSGEINRKVDKKEAMLAAVADRFADGRVDNLDGLTVNYDDWWFNLRPSNTEPFLRLNVEARNAEQLEARLGDVMEILTQ